jgi:hypothetical protein
MCRCREVLFGAPAALPWDGDLMDPAWLIMGSVLLGLGLVVSTCGVLMATAAFTPARLVKALRIVDTRRAGLALILIGASASVQAIVRIFIGDLAFWATSLAALPVQILAMFMAYSSRTK